MRLHALDVRVKLVCFVAIMVAVITLSHPLWTTALLAGLLAALAAAGTPLRGLRAVIEPLVPVLVLVVAVTLVTGGRSTAPDHVGVLITVGPMTATVAGLLVGLNLVARILVMVVATYAVTISTPVDDLLVVMATLRAPTWLSILVTTAISAIPTMARKKDLIIDAQRARGARVRNSGPIGRITAVIPLMVPLITGSILMAENLAIALTNRGYGARTSMTMLRELRLRRSDLVVLTLVLAVVAVLVWLRFARGYGRL